MGKLSKNIFAFLFIAITIVWVNNQTKKSNVVYFEKDELYMQEAQEFERKQKEMYEKLTKPNKEKFVNK